MKLFFQDDVMRFVKVRMNKLEEVKFEEKNENGTNTTKEVTVRKGPSFASTDFAWSTPLNSKFGDQMVLYSSGISNFVLDGTAVTFRIHAHMMSAYYSTTATVGDVSITVPRNTIKFDIEVTGWPFSSDNATQTFLKVTLDVSGSGGRGAPVIATQVYTKNSNEKRITVGGGFLDVPTLALIDGAKTAVAVSLTDSSIDILFPKGGSIIYDPIIAAATVNSWSWFILLAVLIVL